jgi:hypothetical protein
MRKVKEQDSPFCQGFEPLESRLLLAGDLSVAIGALPGDIPTGYMLNVSVTVTNNDPTKVSGTATLTVGFNDGVHGLVTLATKVTSLSLAPGGHLDLVIPSKIPIDAAIGADTLQVTTVAGALTSNTPTASPNITWDFGNIPGLGNVSLTATDPATGHTGVFSLTGPGMGSLSDPRTIWDMNLTGTTRASKVSVTGAVDLEQITAATMVGTVNAPQADFTAAGGAESSSLMTFTGGLLSLTMHDSSVVAATVHNVTVGNGDFKKDALAIKFNNVNDLAVNSWMPISSFTAASYMSHVGGPWIYTSAYIGSVVITGNFTGIYSTSLPRIHAEGANPAGGLGIASISVGGNMDSSGFYTHYGKIGPVHIGGFMDHGAVVYASYGSIGNARVDGYMDHGATIRSEYGGVGSVHVGGNVDNDSYIQVGNQGNMGAVWIGGNLDHSSEVYIWDNGNIASVYVKGNVDNSSRLICDNHGNIGKVEIRGNLDHDAQIYIHYQGNIASVSVGGNLDNSAEIYISSGGDIGPVQIKGNLDHSAEIYTDYGDIASVKVGGKMDNSAFIKVGDAGGIGSVSILGNLDNSAEVYVNYGAIGPVSIGGNLDNGAKIHTEYGAIGNVSIGGNLDNSAQVYASSGNIGDVKIGRNLDHNAEVYSDDGSVGVGKVSVGGNFSNGAQVYAYGAAIKSVKVLGDSLWTSGTSPKIYAYTTIGSIDIGGKSIHGDFEAGGSIGSIRVGGLMQNGYVNCFEGGDIGSMSVGQLDATTVQIGVQTPLAGTRDDFITQNSSIGTFKINGIKTGGVFNYITGGSQILAWDVGKITCGGPSVGGSGLIEFHTGNVVMLPAGVTETLVP